MSTKKLKAVSGFLKVLGLATDRVPSMDEAKAAYKELFYLHPDKAGEESTARFQEITEAAKEVFEFLTLKGNVKVDDIDVKDVLGILVKNNNLVFNKMSVTFDLTNDTVDAWMSQFESILGKSKPLPNSEIGIQYKKESWSLDCDSSTSLTTFGSVSICFYSTTLKVVIQGSTFLHFATFAIPQIVERMSKAKEPTEVPAVVEEAEVFFDAATLAANTNSEHGNILVEGFKRMENAVVALRTELIKKVDESVSIADNTNGNTKLDAIAQKLDKLDTLLGENKTEMVGINEKLTIIADKNVSRLDPADVQELATAVSGISGTKETELAVISSVVKEVRDKLENREFDKVVNSNKEVLDKLDSVKELSDTVSKGLEKLESIFEKDLFKNVTSNSEQSVNALNSMNKHMESLLLKFDAIPNAVPASNTAPTEPVIATSDTDPVEKKKVRKGKLFSSSVSLGCDKKKFEYKLNCEMEIIETYHILENKTAPDPEKYLRNMLKNHMKVGEVDFIILSVGSNDITFLSNEKDVCALNKEALEHSAILVDIAKETADRFDIDVFVIERPTRYDKKEKDPKSVKSTVNQSANGLLVALTSVLDNVHAIKLPAFENLSEKSRKSFYKNDGIHFIRAGLIVIEDKVIDAVRNVFTDLEQIPDDVENSTSPDAPQHRDGDSHRNADVRDGAAGGGYDRRDHGDRVQYQHQDRREFRGQPAGQHRREFRGQPAGQHRHNEGNRNNGNGRQEQDMQNMVRNFMAFMENGPGRYPRNGGRGRY